MKTTIREKPPYELEDRTYEFALRVRLFLKQRAWEPANWPDVNQLLRSSGSVASNYLEAQEGVSDADFNNHLRICRKETRESALWLRLLIDTNHLSKDEESEVGSLVKESVELTKIVTSILLKREPKR